ncbi:DUF1905 domain-containing protein [Hymenobacter busanensis]|uniref:DUF1905 domain-containing protein n=1 Tax=Hymenobacter busanensis TaxID=2607656 RepID=A0A7L5A2W9_9BACT|nr:YdeI/OmpD-associated family protein [Hymenobacter busanensis]KAA9338180.1 DUF1905 domain-containing protein [Hymenobacter busanensis]QHJ09395.1 DUF1905 domain-containing protein [Hymenobacter busanensis]
MNTPAPAFEPEHTFEAVLELDSEHGGVFVIIPFNVAEVYGTRGQVKVQATFDGFPYRGSLAPMGDGQHLLGVPRQIRNAIEKTWGHTVTVALAKDTQPRVAEVSDDFARALTNAGARQKFEDLSYTHQKEFTRWVEAAKSTETRYERMKKAVEMILAGQKRS